MELIRRALSSRTVRVAIIQAIVGVLGALATMDPALKTVGWLAFVKSIADVLLRLDTTAPVGEPPGKVSG